MTGFKLFGFVSVAMMLATGSSLAANVVTQDKVLGNLVAIERQYTVDLNSCRTHFAREVMGYFQCRISADSDASDRLLKAAELTYSNDRCRVSIYGGLRGYSMSVSSVNHEVELTQMEAELCLELGFRALRLDREPLKAIVQTIQNIE